MGGPKVMPRKGLPAVRLPDTPPSPPKNSGTIKAMANTSSAMPRVIMAKGVPALRVVTKPSTMANPAPAKPPTRGIRLTGTDSQPCPTWLSAWMATKEARPV